MTYNDYASYAKGNLGSNITPGSNKSLILDYRDSVQNILDYQIKLEADDDDSVNIQEIVNKVDRQRLKNTVGIIEGKRYKDDGLSHLEAVKDTIDRRFKNQKLFTYRQSFEHENYQAENVIGSFRVCTLKNKLI